jgi:hypothetical protein
MVGIAASQMACSVALERIATVQDAPIVEPDQVPRSERIGELEAGIARRLGEHAQRFVGPGYVVGRHVWGAADGVRVGRSVCCPRSSPVWAVESGLGLSCTLHVGPKLVSRIGPTLPINRSTKSRSVGVLVNRHSPYCTSSESQVSNTSSSPRIRDPSMVGASAKSAAVQSV